MLRHADFAGAGVLKRPHPPCCSATVRGWCGLSSIEGREREGVRTLLHTSRDGVGDEDQRIPAASTPRATNALPGAAGRMRPGALAMPGVEQGRTLPRDDVGAVLGLQDDVTPLSRRPPRPRRGSRYRRHPEYEAAEVDAPGTGPRIEGLRSKVPVMISPPDGCYVVCSRDKLQRSDAGCGIDGRDANERNACSGNLKQTLIGGFHDRVVSRMNGDVVRPFGPP